jgi:hypothetical protein
METRLYNPDSNPDLTKRLCVRFHLGSGINGNGLNCIGIDSLDVRFHLGSGINGN